MLRVDVENEFVGEKCHPLAVKVPTGGRFRQQRFRPWRRAWQTYPLHNVLSVQILKTLERRRFFRYLPRVWLALPPWQWFIISLFTVTVVIINKYVLLNKYYLLVYFRQLIFLRLVPRNGDSDWLWVSFSLGRKGYRLIWELGWPSYSLIVSIPFKALRYAPGNDCSLTYVDQLPYLRSVINTRSPSAFMMYCCSLRSLVFDQSFLRTEPVNPSLEGAN